MLVDGGDQTELFSAFDDTEVAFTVSDIRLPTLEARPHCYPGEARPHNLCDELGSDYIIDQRLANDQFILDIVVIVRFHRLLGHVDEIEESVVSPNYSILEIKVSL